jgi:riboflavin kinase/FMN adenylyltransferase
MVPGNGVYAVKAVVGNDTWPAAANVGPNPTFGENARKVEVHLLGFSGDLYDRPLAIDFIGKIRDTRPFGSAQELVAQIQKDIGAVRKILGSE